MTYVFNIDIDIETPVLENNIAASTYKGHIFPDGELPPPEKDMTWADFVENDYNDFLESVEDYLTDAYNLTVYYKHKSKYRSMYFGMLAKDSDGNILFRFGLKLRISNHDSRRSKASQQQKQLEKHAIVKQYGKIPKAIVKSITVNNEKFDNYLDVIIYIDDVIDVIMAKMQR